MPLMPRVWSWRGYDANPLEDGSLEGRYRLFKVPMTKLTEGVEGLGLSQKRPIAAATSSPWDWSTGCTAASWTDAAVHRRASSASKPTIAEANAGP
jgi:hypothetical protein